MFDCAIKSVHILFKISSTQCNAYIIYILKCQCSLEILCSMSLSCQIYGKNCCSRCELKILQLNTGESQNLLKTNSTLSGAN